MSSKRSLNNNKRIMIFAAISFAVIGAAIFMIWSVLIRQDSGIASVYHIDLKAYGSSFHTVRFYDGEGAIIYEEQVKTGDTIKNVPELHKEGYVFNGWIFPNYANLYPKDQPVMEDMDIYPDIIEQRLVVLNALTDSGMNAEDIDVERLEAMTDDIRELIRERN